MRTLVVVLVATLAAVAAGIVVEPRGTSAPLAHPPRAEHVLAVETAAAVRPLAASSRSRTPTIAADAAGRADGVVPPGTTVFDDDLPAVARLDPALLDALRSAASDARADEGVTLEVNSGWRSRKYQQQLLREAVATYGSEEEAARWVATPDTSPHVAGDAVDIGQAGAAWLSAHGAEYGLCPVYRNEPWHYERRADADRRGCPDLYADPTQDPRMQG